MYKIVPKYFFNSYCYVPGSNPCYNRKMFRVIKISIQRRLEHKNCLSDLGHLNILMSQRPQRPPCMRTAAKQNRKRDALAKFNS